MTGWLVGEEAQTAGAAIKTTNWHAATGQMTHNRERRRLNVLLGLDLHLRFPGVHQELNSLLAVSSRFQHNRRQFLLTLWTH